MEPANASGPSVSLSSLFREYLHQDDSLEDVELKPASSVRVAAPVQVAPAGAVAEPVKPMVSRGRSKALAAAREARKPLFFPILLVATEKKDVRGGSHAC